MAAQIQILLPLTLGLAVITGVALGIWTDQPGLALVMLGIGALLASYRFRLHRPLEPEITHPFGREVPMMLARDDYYWQPTGILLILAGVALVGVGFFFAFWR